MRFQREAAFILAGTIAAYYALRGGGFDPVVRQGAAFLLLWVLTVGFATGLLPRARPPAGWFVPILALTGLALFTLLSLSWSDSHERTFNEFARVLQYVGILALAFSLLTRHTWTAAAGGVSAALLGVCALAVASRLFPDAFPEPEVTKAFFQAGITERLSYPLQYWNAVAAWGAMAIAVGLAWSAHAERLGTRALSLAAVPIAGSAVYLTYSRAGVIGTSVALIAVVALGYNRWMTVVHAAVAGGGSWLAIDAIRSNPGIAERSTGNGAGDVITALVVAAIACAAAVAVTRYMDGNRWRLPVEAGRAGFVAIIAASLIAVVTVAREPISDAWDDFQNKDQTAGSGAGRLSSFGGNRKDAYDSALEAYRSEELHGIGAGTFQFWWDRDARDPEYIVDAHSLYLEQLAELGVVGFSLIVIALLGLLVLAVQARARAPTLRRAGASCAMTAAFCVFIVHAGVDWMWEYTAVTVVGLGAGGIAAMGMSHSWRGRRGEMIGLRVGATAAALVAAAVQLPGYLSTHWERDSAGDLRAGRTNSALAAADNAVKVEPWAATPYVQRALVREEQGEIDAAIDQAQQAVDKEPDYWRHRLLLARLEAEDGRARAAQRELREARRLRPLSPTVKQETAKIRKQLRQNR